MICTSHRILFGWSDQGRWYRWDVWRLWDTWSDKRQYLVFSTHYTEGTVQYFEPVCPHELSWWRHFCLQLKIPVQ